MKGEGTAFPVSGAAGRGMCRLGLCLRMAQRRTAAQTALGKKGLPSLMPTWMQVGVQTLNKE